MGRKREPIQAAAEEPKASETNGAAEKPEATNGASRPKRERLSTDDALRLLDEIADQEDRVAACALKLVEIEDQRKEAKKEYEGQIQIARNLARWRRQLEAQRRREEEERKRQPLLEQTEELPDSPADLDIKYLGFDAGLEELIRQKLDCKTVRELDDVANDQATPNVFHRLMPAEREIVLERLDKFFHLVAAMEQGLGREPTTLEFAEKLAQALAMTPEPATA